MKKLNKIDKSSARFVKKKTEMSPIYKVIYGRGDFYNWYLGGSDGKVSDCNARDPGLIPGLGRSPGERNGNPLQYSFLEDSMDGGAW